MLVSYEWIKNYVDIDMSPEELAEKLTMVGLEIESVTPFNPGLNNIVVGKVLSVQKHPQADKLFVARVDVKEEILEIVVGIDNFKTGDLVPVAKPGSVLPNGLKIKKTKLRGVSSDGMLCSAEEMGLNFCHEYGILVLDEVHPVGQKIEDALKLNDWVLEIGLTPNRSDCLGLIGLAYEISAVTGAPLNIDYPKIPEVEEKIEELADIKILDEDLCSRYSAKIVKNIKIKPSPLWLQRRLLTAGIRPISNIVDVTNYVMWEYGQPLHAFDYEKVKDNKIIVRRAYKGEKLVTLDEQERSLDEDVLVIADPSGSVALAGVMGGLNTEITDNTDTVFLESAIFDPTSIRMTSRELGLSSEASLRFEKGVDPNGTAAAAERAAHLMALLSEGQVVKGILDKYPQPVFPAVVNFRPERARKVIGLNLSDKEIRSIFQRLRFKVREENKSWKVEIPTRRRDIAGEIDLIEESARLYGYQHIKTTLPTGAITQGRKTREQKLLELAKKILTACGLNETITYSFVNPKIFDDLRLAEDNPLRKVVKIYNPLSEEQAVMRTTLLVNLLSVIKYNVSRNIYNQRIFELGSIFLPPKDAAGSVLPEERATIAMAITGTWGEISWHGKPVPVNFYRLKGIVETLLDGLGIKDYEFNSACSTAFHSSRAAELKIGEEQIGILGEIHADVTGRYDLEERVYAAELNFASIMKHADLKIDFKPLPRYPAVLRDIAIIVKDNILAEDINRLMWDVGEGLVEKITLFDVFQGEQIPAGYKSLAYSIVYRSKEKTLTDKEVNEVHQKIVSSLEEKFEARLRY